MNFSILLNKLVYLLLYFAFQILKSMTGRKHFQWQSLRVQKEESKVPRNLFEFSFRIY